MPDYGFHFAQPWWLLAALLVVPAVWLGRRSLGALSTVRRTAAVTLRVLGILALAALLAEPTATRIHRQLTVIAVLDRSQSVPAKLQESARSYLGSALETRLAGDRFALIDAAEAAFIARLPSQGAEVPERSTSLTGQQSDLAAGVQLSMAIAPPDTATRILLVSDGNETAGDLRDAARIAAANRIPIDVLPLQYHYPQEVIARTLVSPARARSGQSVALRLVLVATAPARGRVLLTLNDQTVDLDPDSPDVTAPVSLKPGTNVTTVSVPLGTAGVHKFAATFIPDDPSQDALSQNNRAESVTLVAGAGHLLLVAEEDAAAAPLAATLKRANLDVRTCGPSAFPTQLPDLLNTDAVILVNIDNSLFTREQQEMICRYVTDLGGGLVMVGGPSSFGAGGWIGSPVAAVLPVDLDPPQKKEMPKGALVLVMHACEMPRGNFWGKTVAIAAVRALSRLDLVGVTAYDWNTGGSGWVFPLGPVGDKKAVIAAIDKMEMGDMPDFGTPLRAALIKLKNCDAVQKHIIIISDGDPSMPGAPLLKELKDAGITCTGVAVSPHSPADVASLTAIAKETGGRFYHVQDPNKLPQIFVKEAQVVRRTLVIEEPFVPQLTDSLNETVRGIGGQFPQLRGFVLTGPKGGIARVVLTNPQGDPILATGRSGLGRSVAFTSSADSRWAPDWLAWPGFNRFWEQAVRWAAKPARETECEVYADVQGRDVAVTVDAVDAAGRFTQFANVAGQVIAPDMSLGELALTQVGPGRYRGSFRATASGSYLVNLRYRKTDAPDKLGLAEAVVNVPYAPEFRDLTDNTGLLTEVATMTGGRVLPSDPAQADLFSRAGLRFPETGLPLTRPLMIAWLVLFLLDVAVRRIALDVRAIARRAAVLLTRFRRPGRAATTVLDRLKSKHDELRERLSRQPRDAAAARRYEAPAGATGEPPLADLRAPEAPAEKPKPTTEGRQPPAQPETPLGRLLDAKRKAQERFRKEDEKQ